MRRLSFPHAFYLLLAMVLVSVTACDDDDDAPACDLSATATAEAFEINVAATGGTAPYRYSIDGENFDSNTRIEVDEATNYTVTVRDANDCEVTVDVTGTSLEQFTDTRDDQVYRVVKIGDQIWLGENLNYDTDEGDFCYDDETDNCNNDGKLYTWAAAQAAVPNGWSIPSVADRNALITELGGSTSEDAERTANAAMQPEGTSGWDDQYAGLYDVGDMDYLGLDDTGRHWLSDEASTGRNEAMNVRNNTTSRSSVVSQSHENRLSVRLIKD
ncbi:MAG: FISUMP domain-containing protein [Bacteroidota bacterium]